MQPIPGKTATLRCQHGSEAPGRDQTKPRLDSAQQKEKGPGAAPQGLRKMLTKTLSALHFLQTGSLATQAAEVKELGAADTSRTNLFDLVHYL